MEPLIENVWYVKGTEQVALSTVTEAGLGFTERDYYIEEFNVSFNTFEEGDEYLRERGFATEDEVFERLEYLRGEIEAERISYSEIAELQALAPNIQPGDLQLLQWAGVEEN